MMTHFRGQIRGPHWGPTMDNLLIEFWRKHECLFNSSLESFYDKDLKTKLWTEFSLSIGKPVSDVERRSRSLRTQYGRVLWHPEKASTFQQRMLREKLDFLRPYIIRRRGDSFLEDKFDDREEDEDEVETEGSIDQEMGSTFGSPLDGDELDPEDEPQSVDSLPNPGPKHCVTLQPQTTDVACLSCDNNEVSAVQMDQAAAAKHNILNQFVEVMLADMRQIKDPMVLMRLRRDITDLVFKAVEEDVQRRCIQVQNVPLLAERRPLQSFSGSHRAQLNFSCRQRFLKRKNKGSDMGRRMQRWEEGKHTRKESRNQPVLHAPGGTGESSSQAVIQASEIKTESEPCMVKVEDEAHPSV